MNSPFSEHRTQHIGLAILALISVLAIFVALLSIDLVRKRNDFETNIISVQGEGRAFAVPDTAVFSYTVQAEAPTAAEAQSAIAKSAGAIMKALESEGVEEKDIKTTSFNVYPRFEYRSIRNEVLPQGVSQGAPAGIDLSSSETRIAISPDYYPPDYYPGDQERVLVGYEATQTNQVRVRDTEKAGDFLAMTTENGASDVSSLQFIVWDESAVEQEARAEAIKDAKEKAEELTGALGVHLGKVVSFSEDGGYYPEPYYARGGDASQDFALESAPKAEISLGENEVHSSVFVTYEIN